MGIFSSKEEGLREPDRNYTYDSHLRPSTYTHSLSTTREPNRNYINESPPRPPSTYNYSYRREPPQLRTPTRQAGYYNNEYDYEGAIRRFESLRISRQPTRSIEGPQRSKSNPQLLDSHTTPIVTYTELESWDSEYLKITRMITNKKNFKVDSIEKIENPYLEKAFELKKLQKETQFPYVQERLLFHGTKRAYVDVICKMNFDWRRCQAHKYGKGVSFSPNSTYASVYSDEGRYNKVMIVAKVLIGNSCIGNQLMVVPPDGCDTSQKGNDGIVIVKFEDNEFCPVFKINYHVMDDSVGKGPKKGQNKRRGKPVRQNLAGAMYLYDDDFYDLSDSF